MANLEMPHGPLSFDETEVGKVEENNLGNYALGFIRSSDSAFIPRYVGRSDSDLQKELKAKLSTKSQTRTHFMFSYAGAKKQRSIRSARTTTTSRNSWKMKFIQQDQTERTARVP